MDSKTRLSSSRKSGNMDNDPRDLTLHALQTRSSESEEQGGNAAPGYRTYKRRWLGLAQLTLMNIIVSWDVS